MTCAAPAAAQDTAPREPPLRRWYEIELIQIASRYRVIENTDGEVTNNQLQYRLQFRSKFKFDRRGRYAVHAGVFTGSTFTSSWNTTGLGTGSPVTNLRLKQLFVAAAPVEGVRLQAGGLYVERGESTEITTYDEDAFIMGARVQVARPKAVWFDDLMFTQARLDNITRPSVTHRWDGLGHPNYRQVVARKIFGRVAASTGFTAVQGARTLRGAISIGLAPMSLRLEGYHRIRPRSDEGFALTVERSVSRRLRVTGGFATIDPDYGGLNGDRYDRGQRLFGSAAIAFTPRLNLALFATRGVANDVPIANRARFDAVLSYNLLDLLRRTGVF